MKKLIIIASLVSSVAWASKMEVVGEGAVSRPAEFLKLNITITSECHPSAVEARKSVDAVAAKAQVILDQFRDSAVADQVQVAVGSNAQAPKKQYVNGQEVTICDLAHSWTSNTHVAFKLSQQDQLAAVQDLLLSVTAGQEQNGGLNKPGVSLTLAKPEPGIFSDTWDNMNDEALKRAYAHALRQVKVISDMQPNAQIRLLKMVATNDSSGAVIYDRVTTEGDTAGGNGRKVAVKIARLFIFDVN